MIAGSDVLAMATWFSASAVIVPIASAFNIAPAERGWITAAVQFGFVIAAVASALVALADSVEPRTLIRIGMLVATAANAAILVVHSPALLLFLRFLTGAGLAFVYPPSVRLLNAWFPRSRGIVTGIAVGALTIGSFAPHLFAGDLPWRGVVLAASVCALLGVPLISIVTLPPAYPRAGRFDVGALRMILSNRSVMLADAGYWGHMWELYAVWAWGPVFYAASLQAAHVRAPAGALIFLFFGLIGAAGCIIAGILGDRFGRTLVAGAAMAVSGTISSVIGYAFGSNPWFVSVLFAIWGFAVIADSAQFSAAVTELADTRYAGTALTFQMGVGFLVTMLTIWLVGALQPLLGWGRAFMVLAAGPAAGVYAMSLLYLRLSRTTGRQQRK